MDAFPPAITLHLEGFIGDFQTLARIRRVCKSWRVDAPSVEKSAWRTRYELDFEIESGCDDCIASDGPTTLWRIRYSRRHAIDAQWISGVPSRKTAIDIAPGVPITMLAAGFVV